MNNQGAVNQAVAGAQAQGQQLQSQYNQQAGQQYGNYQNATNQANSAYQNLSNYNSSLQDPSQMYSQDLGNAQQMYGFNPQDLLKANQNLANSQTTLANLPQATQQQGNYYGTTAGAMANNYASQAGNIQNVIAGQGNAVNAFQSVLGATQNQANQQATLGLQGEQLKSQNYQALYSTATQQMQTAGQTLSQIEQLQQQQGYLTAQQVNQYQSAYNGYVAAQAAAEQASASMISAQAQASQVNQQVAMMQQVQQKYGVQGVAGAMGVPSSVINPAAVQPRSSVAPSGAGSGNSLVQDILSPFKSLGRSFNMGMQGLQV